MKALLALVAWTTAWALGPGAWAQAASEPKPAAAQPTASGPALVVKVQRQAVMAQGAPVADVAEAMVSDGIQMLMGTANAGDAWRALVTTHDVVGIKISTATAPLQATRREVVDAIARGLHGAGLSADQVIVWDLHPDKMKEAGFDPSGRDPSALYRVEAVVPDGWDGDQFYENVLVGKLIWGDLLFGREDQQLNTRSHLPKLLSRTITKLINVPVWQDHVPCGFRGGLYNLSIGALDNTRRFEVPGQTGNPAIAEINALPGIRQRWVLTVADALVVGYGGGSGFKPRYSWNHGALYFSRDPVAIDAVGLQLVETKRAEAKLTPVTPMAGHIQSASKLHLGEADPARITVETFSP